jgi:aryl-alcohol dehydrogenase-like predicted oxidoreductase
MSKFSSKIGLGTAQWGLVYGISNHSGQTPPDEVGQILEFAKASGIKVIDTAQAYGLAEQVLGANDLSDFNVITKIPALNNPHISQYDLDKWLDVSFAQSLQSIGVNSVQGLLLHNCDDLFLQSGPIILRFLHRLKSVGKCRQIGVSIYNSRQINKVLDLFTPDIVQLPFNVFDQRLLRDGTLSALKDLGIEIHARSVFLQGLLLMEIENMPSYFNPWRPQLLAWNRICADLRLPLQHVALDYVISNDFIDQVIVGVESLSQLVDLSSFVYGNNSDFFDVLSLNDQKILNPAMWNLKS